MSRAININASVDDVTDMCAKHGATISVIEPLQSGGTRIVLLNAHDAAVINRVYGTKVLKGAVVRMPIRMRT